MKHASANNTSCSKRSDTDLQLFVDETAFLSSSGYWTKNKMTNKFKKSSSTQDMSSRSQIVKYRKLMPRGKPDQKRYFFKIPYLVEPQMISDKIQDYPLDSSLLYHQMTISHMRFLPPTQIPAEYSAGEIKNCTSERDTVWCIRKLTILVNNILNLR